jgi:methylthioribose-1-phosphate isomerase
MTPPELITKIITEKGIKSPPYSQTIKELME